MRTYNIMVYENNRAYLFAIVKYRKEASEIIKKLRKDGWTAYYVYRFSRNY